MGFISVSIITITSCIILFCVFRVIYMRGYNNGVVDTLSSQKEIHSLLKSKILNDNLYTLGRFDLLFSSDLVLFVMTRIPQAGYHEFITDALTSLKNLESSLPTSVKYIVLRSVKIDTQNSSKEYMFEPLFTNGVKKEGSIT